MEKTRVLITGASGQIGQALVQALVDEFGERNVLATDLKPSEAFSHFEELDILETNHYQKLVGGFKPTIIYHLAGILSAVGEKNPSVLWKVNVQGWINTLNIALENKVSKVFFPSSIAVFGPGSSLDYTRQNVALHPTTVYGISKVAGENLAQYFFRKFGLDVRGIRYPGIISYQSPPGGGTTDYAVDIFYQALDSGRYECFLSGDVRLPMMYVDDAVRGTLELMQANAESLSVRTSYNFGAVSFTPTELATSIRKIIPDFEISYAPDFREEIANTWPRNIDDTPARRDWNWQHQFEIDDIVRDMLMKLKEKNTLRSKKN